MFSFFRNRLVGKSRGPVSKKGIFKRLELLGLEERITPANFEVTSLNDANAGSLRQAILDANATAANDTITFQSGLTGTITLQSSLPTITDAASSGTLTISGPGASSLTISGDNGNAGRNFRIFDIATGGNLTISGVTVSGAKTTASGGAFNNLGTLAISNSTLSGNSSTVGGGIFNSGSGTATLSNSTLSGNTASSNGGGISNSGTATLSNSSLSGNTAPFGGGIFNSGSGTATLSNSTLSGNSATYGGGIFNQGTATLSNSTLSGNTATFSGGGIFNSVSGSATISNSSLSGNTATYTGGGIANDGTATISNSTLSGNSSTVGGGIFNFGSGTATISNSTLSGNTASSNGGGIYNYGTATIYNTIIANSTSGGDFLNGGSGSATASNTLITSGTLSGATTATSAEINLGPLQNNGGPTFTHALLTGSVAIGAGNATISNAPPINGLDQRGFTRTTSDIGAFAFSTTITVNTLTDTVDPVDNVTSLREAITLANSAPSDDSIIFAPSQFTNGDQSITLTQFDSGLDNGEVGPTAFQITSNITIQGPAGNNGLTLERSAANANKFRLFHITGSGSLTLDSLTLSGGLARGGDGGGSVGGGAAGLGGAVFNQGTFNLRNSTLSGNQAIGGNAGGYVYGIGGGGGGLGGNGSNGDFNSNTGGFGGGPNGGIGSTENGGPGGFGGGGGGASSYRVGGSGGFGGGGGGGAITQNFNGSGGSGGFGGGAGGVFGFSFPGFGAYSPSVIYPGASTGGAGLGGAIFNQAGTVVISNSTFTSNTAIGGTGFSNSQGLGGAIFTRNGAVTLLNSTLSGNTANEGGGAVFTVADSTSGTGYSAGNVTLTLNNSILANTTGGASDFAADTIGSGTNTFSGVGNLIESNAASGTHTDPFTGTIASSADPNLAALADNGGPTFTHALLTGSVAIGAGNATISNAPPINGLDQRGFTRITSDIGAFAYLGVPVNAGDIYASIDGSNRLSLLLSSGGVTLSDLHSAYNSGAGILTLTATTTGNIFGGGTGITIDNTAKTISVDLNTLTTFSGIVVEGNSGNDSVIIGAGGVDLSVVTGGAANQSLIITTGTGADSLAISNAIKTKGAGQVSLTSSTIGITADITTTTGNIVLDADSGVQQAGNFSGVKIQGSTVDVTTSGGSITVEGRGGDNGSGSQFGILLNDGAKIHAGGTGTVSVTGTGGASSGPSNFGVFVSGSNLNISTISSSNGAISVTGTGGGSGNSSSNYGVFISQAGVISAGGTGTVTVVGTGGVGSGGNNVGLYLSGSGVSKVTSAGGAVSLTGAAGATSGRGLNLECEISAGAGAPITLTADSINFNTTSGFVTSLGTVTLRNRTPGNTINLGTETAGSLSLTDAELDRITAGSLVIGRNDGTNSGIITVSSALTLTPSLQLIGPAGIALNANVTTTAGPAQVASTITVGSNPYGVAVNPAGTFAYVINFSSDTVSVINTATNAVISTIAVGVDPIGVAFNPAGTLAYVTNFVSGTVSVIDTATNLVTSTITVGSNPYGVAVNPAGTFAYVANLGSNTVSVINTATNIVTSTIAVGSNPTGGVAFNSAGTFAYVTNGDGTVSVINTATLVTSTIAVGDYPTGVAFNPAGTFAYVANSGSDTVSVIDTATNTVTSTIAVGIDPFGVAVNPAGTFAYVTNQSNNTVSVIDTATNTVTNTIPVGSNPLGVDVNPAGTLAYVTNNGTNTVSVIDLGGTGSQTYTGTVTLGNSVTLDTTNAGGSALGANITFTDAITGAFDLNLNAGTAGAISGTSAVVNNLTITNSGGTTFQSTVDAGTVTITDTTDAATVAFQGNLTVGTALVTTAQAYNVSITGTSNSIAGATTFNNTGTVTLGDANADSSTFAGGLVITAPATIVLRGTVATTNTTMTLGDADTGITINGTFGSPTILNAGTGSINLAGNVSGLSANNPLQVITSGAGSTTVSGVNTAELRMSTGVVTIANPADQTGGYRVSGGTLQGGTASKVGYIYALTGTSFLAPGINGPGMMHTNFLALSSGNTVQIDLQGTTPDTGYDQIIACAGANVILNSATLALTSTITPANGTVFTLIDNQSTTAVTGIFADLPEGATLTANGRLYRISYVGGPVAAPLTTGNDVTLTVVEAPAITSASTTTFIVGAAGTFNVTSTGFPNSFTYSATGSLPSGVTLDSNTGLLAGQPASGSSGTYNLTITASNGVSPAATQPFTLKVNPAPSPLITGTSYSAPGQVSTVTLYNPATGEPIGTATPFPGFTGEIHVAAGDVNRDGIPEIIAAAGPGGGPAIAILDSQTGVVLSAFFAYDPAFTGGSFVADADVNGDGFTDILTGAGPGGGPHVKVFDGANLQELASFFAYAQEFTGGVTVGAAVSDGSLFIVTGAGPGGGPHVKVFQGNQQSFSIISQWYAYLVDFSGGVFVAVGDISTDGQVEVVTGAGTGGGPVVAVWNPQNASLLAQFFAYETTFTGGVRVGVSDGNGDGIPDLVTGAGPGGSPMVKGFNFPELDLLFQFFDGPEFNTAGVFVS